MEGGQALLESADDLGAEFRPETLVGQQELVEGVGELARQVEAHLGGICGRIRQPPFRPQRRERRRRPRDHSDRLQGRADDLAMILRFEALVADAREDAELLRHEAARMWSGRSRPGLLDGLERVVVGGGRRREDCGGQTVGNEVGVRLDVDNDGVYLRTFIRTGES